MENKEKSKCCEECINLGSKGEWTGCCDINCPCHTPAEERKQKLERGAKDFANRFEGVMKDLAEENSSPSSDSMTERWEKLKTNFIAVEQGDWWSTDEDFILDFIKSEKALSEREAREYENRIEIWMPCKQGEGTAIKKDGSQMKLVAMLIGSKVLHLEKDFYLEIGKLSKEEAENIIKPNHH